MPSKLAPACDSCVCHVRKSLGLLAGSSRESSSFIPWSTRNRPCLFWEIFSFVQTIFKCVSPFSPNVSRTPSPTEFLLLISEAYRSYMSAVLLSVLAGLHLFPSFHHFPWLLIKQKQQRPSPNPPRLPLTPWICCPMRSSRTRPAAVILYFFFFFISSRIPAEREGQLSASAKP